VYIRRRVGKRRSFFKKHRILLFSLAGACICFFALVFVREVGIPEEIVPSEPQAAFHAPQLNDKFVLSDQERTVYPYSVIPGGVRSREELAARISGDPVVAAHFADFKVSRARVVRTAETRMVYVSYRMRDKVYWTSKKIKVPQGETMITDGKETARTRCGNKVSAAPMLPVSNEEPVVESFEIPLIANLEAPPQLQPIYQPRIQLREFSPLELISTQPSILPYYYRPLFVIRPTSAVVPEPGTLSLLIAGMVTFFAIKIARRK
jgi:hypothetical protein